MTKQEAQAVLAETMEKFLGVACKRLPDDVYEKLRECRDSETSELQRVVYDTYFENLQKAQEMDRPCCQDTGLLHFYINCGADFPYMGIVEKALREATAKATFSAPLRQNTVDFFTERNTGDNTGERMPWLHWEIIPDNSDLEICTYFAGGGCCLPGCAKVFKPSDGYAAIVKYVFDAVSDLGLNACPPLIVGVGLGHNMENAAVLSKMAYLRPLGTHHPHPKGAKLEQDLLDGLNRLGIGAQGLPGNRVAMEVHVESSARHTATIAVGVNVACYAHRRGIITFHQDMSYDIQSYKGVTL